MTMITETVSEVKMTLINIPKSCIAMRSAGSRWLAAASCRAASCQAAVSLAPVPASAPGSAPVPAPAPAPATVAKASVTRAAQEYGSSRDADSLNARASLKLPSWNVIKGLNLCMFDRLPNLCVFYLYYLVAQKSSLHRACQKAQSTFKFALEAGKWHSLLFGQTAL